MVIHLEKRKKLTVVAAGGDGTISAVAGELAGTSALLGVIPMGTLNHFAKDLGLPLDIESALAVIKEGRVRSVDIAEADDRVFINNSSVGLYPHLVRLREHHQSRLRLSKGWAMLRAAATLLHRIPTLEVQLNVDGKKLVRHTPFVFVGNNQYHADGLKIGNRVCLDEGVLSIFTTHHVGRLGFFRLVLKAMFGLLHADKDFDSFKVTEIRIDVSGHSHDVSFDGEVVRMKSPIHYRVRPKALQVIVSREPKSR
ncbi:MAG: diacylglycerol kinase family protein [Verrucomicrobiota bacterium]